MPAPGRLIKRARMRICVSYLNFRRKKESCSSIGRSGSEAIFFHATIESASAQPQRLRCMADIPGMAGQSFFYKQAFYFFETHLFYFCGTGFVALQSEIADLDLAGSAHQNCTLDG